jgi:small-conductance mechanosensitive channel
MVGHLILLSCAWILFILICMILGNALVRRIMSHPRLDRRQAQTLRMVLQVAVQLVGALLILLVLFGAPTQTPTILGLTTAALTIALQDFVLAFAGWFVLMGKRGIRIGDWVEINGVSGEVIEIGLMRTSLLETGNLAERGSPTGRRISFMNSFAIRGQYFNFSTSGQWMWDEITVAVPASVDTHAALERILRAVQEETKENARLADQEWKRGAHGQSLAAFRTDPAVDLRPSGASGVDLEVRYVTRASERFERRNRLYRRVLGVLREPAAEAEPQPSS